MAYANGTRRSTRLAAKPKTTLDPRTHAARPAIQRKPSTRKQSKESQKSLHIKVEALRIQSNGRAPKPELSRLVTRTGRTPTTPSRFLPDSSSEESLTSMETDFETDSADEFDMETDSSESEDEWNEQAHLSHDHFEYRHADDLRESDSPGRRSYDSRIEPGNEEYDLDDDFVVHDDEMVEREGSELDNDDSDLDLEINMERDPVQVGYRTVGRPLRASSIFYDEPLPLSRRPRSISTEKIPPLALNSRRSSQASSRRRRSSSSNLFVSDVRGDPSIPHRLYPWTELGFNTGGEEEVKTPLIAQASAEVVEEIVDALALFSRRVNRDRPPVRLRLAAAVLKDDDIRAPLEDAIRTGLGRTLELADGSRRFSIGAKGRR